MMQVVLRISIGALAIWLTSACANSPPRASTQPAAVDRSQADVDTAMCKLGYKPWRYRGERVYCRSETLTGSNLETTVCLTVEQIEAQERVGKDILNGNRPAGCLPHTACN